MEKELSPHAKAAAIELAKCTSCGMCKDVCPTFVLTRLESESARGKVNLLKALLEESLDPAETSVEIFNRCLLCYACQDACPAGVQTSKIWIAAREILGDEVGRPFAKSFFLQRILPKPGRLHLAMTLSRGLPGDEFTVRLAGHNMPRPSGSRLDKLLPETLEPVGRTRGTVAFFPGCMISDIYPYLGVQAAEILAYLGYRVITPRARVCCGAPAFNNGDMGTARGLAEKNISLFNALEADVVVSPDATCGGAFVHEYDMLFPNGSQWRSAFLALREKTVNYAEFIEKAVSEQPVTSFRPLPYRLTVHDSCHLKYLQQKSHIPRKLLDYVPDLKVLESPQSGLCCGFGGSYSVLYPSESRAITRRKLDYLKQSGSNVVMVGSPGCLWKLRAEAVQLRLDLRIVHYVEILWESLIGRGETAKLYNNSVGVGATPTME